MIFKANAALIDLDGTLVDSLPDIACATNAMRSDLQLASLSMRQISTYVGKGIDVLVHRALTQTMDERAADDLFERGKASFNRHYREVNGDQSRPFDGVVQALHDLRLKGIKLACVTNKPRDFTLQLLEQTNLLQLLDAVVAGGDTVQQKPQAEPTLHACRRLRVSPSDAIVIGDSDNDVTSARAAGCRVIVVLTGYNEGRPASELNADAIVPSVLDASRMIELND